MSLQDDLEFQMAYLREWLNKYKEAQELIPILKQRLDELDWELDALAHRPAEADEIPLDDLHNYFAISNQRMKNVIPPVPDYNRSLIESWTSVNTSGSSSFYESVTRVGDLGTPVAEEYSKKYGALYIDLQIAHNRPDMVRSGLEKLKDPGILMRFDTAALALPTMKAGVKTRTEAALAMRNLIDGLQGVLFEKARKWPNENMTWQEMSKRLSKDANDEFERQELVIQETKRKSLISRLSDVMKGREGGSVTNLDDIWAQTLDHIHIVLGLIKT
jgi:hypothetical protein